LTPRKILWQAAAIESYRPTRILLIRLSALGDVLFTLPAVNTVRDSFPTAQLAYLSSTRCAPLLEGFEGVARTFLLDRDAFRRASPRDWWRNTIGLASRLRRARFDLVIDFHGFGETALFARLTGAPQRWGSLDKIHRRFGYTSAIQREYRCHPIDINLKFLRQCGLPEAPIRNEFLLSAECLRRGEIWFTKHGLEIQHPTIFIQPFTSTPRKNWPLQKFLEFARHWRQRGVRVIFGGGPADREILAPAAQALFPVSAGVDLLTTASLMHLSTVVIGGDTGIMHLAVACGRRVVMLMNEVAPYSSFPHAHRDWVVSPPSGKRVQDLEMAEVIYAVQGALGQPARLV